MRGRGVPHPAGLAQIPKIPGVCCQAHHPRVRDLEQERVHVRRHKGASVEEQQVVPRRLGARLELEAKQVGGGLLVQHQVHLR